MARGQDPARRRRAGGRLTAAGLVVVVQDRVEALAALALAEGLGQEIELAMEVGIAGPAFARALEKLLERPVIGLCDDNPGLAMEALRGGLRRLVCAAPAEPLARLADIARQLGGEVTAEPPGPLHAVAPDGRGFLPFDPSAPLGSPRPLVP